MKNRQHNAFQHRDITGCNQSDGLSTVLSDFSRDLGRKIGEYIRNYTVGRICLPNSEGALFRVDQLTYNYLFNYLQDMYKKNGYVKGTGIFKYSNPNDGYNFGIFQFFVDEFGIPIRATPLRTTRAEDFHALFGRYIHAMSADRILQGIFSETNQFIINLDKTWQSIPVRPEQSPVASYAGHPADRPYSYPDAGYASGRNDIFASEESLDYNALRSSHPLNASYVSGRTDNSAFGDSLDYNGLRASRSFNAGYAPESNDNFVSGDSLDYNALRSSRPLK